MAPTSATNAAARRGFAIKTAGSICAVPGCGRTVAAAQWQLRATLLSRSAFLVTLRACAGRVLSSASSFSAWPTLKGMSQPKARPVCWTHRASQPPVRGAFAWARCCTGTISRTCGRLMHLRTLWHQSPRRNGSCSQIGTSSTPRVADGGCGSLMWRRLTLSTARSSTALAWTPTSGVRTELRRLSARSHACARALWRGPVGAVVQGLVPATRGVPVLSVLP
jgi:hypothetical protein